MTIEKDVEVNATDTAVDYLVKKGFSAKLGARPLQRIIDDEIKNPLSKMILFGELNEGGMVEVTLSEDIVPKLTVVFRPNEIGKLFYSKFRVKSVFILPGSLMFYPTTDKHLMWLKKEYSDAPAMHKLADFIIKNRKDMRFRFQDKKALFYTNEIMAQELVDLIGKYHVGTEILDPRFIQISSAFKKRRPQIFK